MHMRGASVPAECDHDPCPLVVALPSPPLIFCFVIIVFVLLLLFLLFLLPILLSLPFPPFLLVLPTRPHLHRLTSLPQASQTKHWDLQTSFWWLSAEAQAMRLTALGAMCFQLPKTNPSNKETIFCDNRYTTKYISSENQARTQSQGKHPRLKYPPHLNVDRLTSDLLASWLCSKVMPSSFALSVASCRQKLTRVAGTRAVLDTQYKWSGWPRPFVAPYCAIPRDYLSDTPLLRAMGFLVSQHGQLGAIPPPPFSESFPLGKHAKWRCDTPPGKGVSQRYLRDTLWKQGKRVRIPPSAILSRKGIARYGGVSRTGPPSKLAMARPARSCYQHWRSSDRNCWRPMHVSMRPCTSKSTSSRRRRRPIISISHAIPLASLGYDRLRPPRKGAISLLLSAWLVSLPLRSSCSPSPQRHSDIASYS